MTSRTRAIRWTCAASALCAAAALALGDDDPWRLMPESASVEADTIDRLTYLILWVTGVTFVGVQAALVWFLWKYRARPGNRAKHTHGNHTVELVWTVAPAAILVFLAVYQMGLWTELKSSKPADNAGAIPVRIYGKQFEWNMRYPGADGVWDTADDLLAVKTLVTPVNRPVNVELRAMDVLHSFYLPNLRFKQDAVPGLHGKLWFRPSKLSADRRPVRNRDGAEVKLEFFDIVCAELCGNLHTTMSGRYFVVTDEQFAAWQRGEQITLPGGTTIPKPTKWSDVQSPYDFIWSTWANQDDTEVKGPPKWQREPFGADVKGAEEAQAPEEPPPPPSGDTAYDKLKGTATLRGVIKYVGTIPKQEVRNKSSQPLCMAHGDTPVEDKEVNVANSTLPHAFVHLVSGPTAGRTGYEVPELLVDQKGCAYIPHVFGALVNQDVKFRNSDTVSHNVKVNGGRLGNTFNKTQSASQVDVFKPATKEFAVKIICDVHSWMNSYMHVVENPFNAVSARGTGAFEIKGLYPGKHKFKVWHEKWARAGNGVEFEIELKEGDNVQDVTIQGDK